MLAVNRRPPTKETDANDLTLIERKDGQRILMAGSRQWTDLEVILNILRREHDKQFIDYIIHGNNGYDINGRSLDQDEDFISYHHTVRGADKLAGKAAAILHIPILAFSPDWKNYERAAGPRRNLQMILHGKPTKAFLFHDDISSSRGTVHMRQMLITHQIPYEIVSH